MGIVLLGPMSFLPSTTWWQFQLFQHGGDIDDVLLLVENFFTEDSAVLDQNVYIYIYILRICISRQSSSSSESSSVYWGKPSYFP